MNTVKAFGKFEVRNGTNFRHSTYVKFGSSDKIIGACIMCNPGSSQESETRCKVNDTFDTNEITIDDTMEQLIAIVTGAYGADVEGVLKIFNLFTLKDPDMGGLVSGLKKLGSEDYEILYKDFTDFQEISKELPWILVGWGCQDNALINEQRNKWCKYIQDSNLKIIGVRSKSSEAIRKCYFLHPLPRIFNERQPYRIEAIEQLKGVILLESKSNVVNKDIVRFPKWATKPNILTKYNKENKMSEKSGWTLDIHGPKDIVDGYSNLRIKSEYKMVGYKYSDGGNGNGLVWAIPADAEVKGPDECNRLDDLFLNPPRPDNALNDYMEAIDGDCTPFSYLQAAILLHELGEYGAAWHGISWDAHSILPIDHEIKGPSYEWDMVGEEPVIIDPHFYFNEDNEPIIVFYTISNVGTVTLNEFKHIFSKDNYSMQVERKVLGTAGAGIIF